MKILVVDDYLDAADALAIFLRAAGYQVQVAHNAVDAAQAATVFIPDLALLDIGLPRMDGWELGKLLRSLPGLAELPIVAVTGYGRPEDYQRSIDAGFEYHIIKPLDFALLETIVKAHAPSAHAAEVPPLANAGPPQTSPLDPIGSTPQNDLPSSPDVDVPD